MKLVEYDINKITKRSFKRTKNQDIIESFIDSDMECARIDGWSQSNAHSCMASLTNSIKRYRYFGVQAITRQGEVYLIRTDNDFAK